MRRRDAVARLMALAALCGARVAAAQVAKAARPYRIIVFPDVPPTIRSMIAEEIRALGWVEGHDVVVQDSGFAYGSPNHVQAAERVAKARPDLILTYSSNYALALHRATPTTPIVMWTSGYPVEVGIAESLARPGKNVTGNTQYAGTGFWGKQVELLREAKPGTKRVAVCWGYVPPDFPKEEIDPCYRELRLAANSLGATLTIVEFPSADRVPASLAQIEAANPEAMLVTTGPAIWAARTQVMAYAIRRRLPTIGDFHWPETESHAPVLQFAPSTGDQVKRAVAYIDRIRKGARPGLLPIQLPAKFELVVNRAAAQSIDLAIPQSVLLRADRVIE